MYLRKKLYFSFFILAFIACSKADTEPIDSSPVIDFDYSASDNGKVKFINLSKNVDSLQIQFGDYSANGQQIDTTHIYLKNGEYLIRLEGKNQNGEVISKEKTITVSNRKVLDDSTKYICKENSLSLKTDIGDLCSSYSEFGGVILKRNKLGRECSFWYTFTHFSGQSVYEYPDYEFFVVTTLLINDIGTYEFEPKQSDYRNFSLNSAWIQVSYNEKKILPWNFKFATMKKVKINITNFDESHISGTVEFTIDENHIFRGSFKNLVIRPL